MNREEVGRPNEIYGLEESDNMIGPEQDVDAVGDVHAESSDFSQESLGKDSERLESDRLRFVQRASLFPVKGRLGSAPMSIMIGRFMLILQLLLGLILPWMDYCSIKKTPALQTLRQPSSAWAAGFYTSLFFTGIIAFICYCEYKGITAKSLVKKRVVEKKVSFLISLGLSLLVLLAWLFS